MGTQIDPVCETSVPTLTNPTIGLMYPMVFIFLNQKTPEWAFFDFPSKETIKTSSLRIFVRVRSSQVLDVTKVYNSTLRGADKTESKEIGQKDQATILLLL
ncbi:MAG TPA: hypothetical protein VJC13_02045 [Candidatus Paceibacterota bacterium]